jgi:hypothetical protein
MEDGSHYYSNPQRRKGAAGDSGSPFRQRGDYEVTVADGGSRRDRACEIVASDPPSVPGGGSEGLGAADERGRAPGRR